MARHPATSPYVSDVRLCPSFARAPTGTGGSFPSPPGPDVGHYCTCDPSPPAGPSAAPPVAPTYAARPHPSDFLYAPTIQRLAWTQPHPFAVNADMMESPENIHSSRKAVDESMIFDLLPVDSDASDSDSMICIPPSTLPNASRFNSPIQIPSSWEYEAETDKQPSPVPNPVSTTGPMLNNAYRTYRSYPFRYYRRSLSPQAHFARNCAHSEPDIETNNQPSPDIQSNPSITFPSIGRYNLGDTGRRGGMQFHPSTFPEQNPEQPHQEESLFEQRRLDEAAKEGGLEQATAAGRRNEISAYLRSGRSKYIRYKAEREMKEVHMRELVQMREMKEKEMMERVHMRELVQMWEMKKMVQMREMKERIKMIEEVLAKYSQEAEDLQSQPRY